MKLKSIHIGNQFDKTDRSISRDIFVRLIMNKNSSKISQQEGEQFLNHCLANNLDGVGICLSRGVDVNTVSEDGSWSGLTIAADKNYQELLEILLSHPDIKINNTTDNRQLRLGKWTALMFACKRGNSAIVSRLVQLPMLDINYQDEQGFTAAHWVSLWGETEYVRMLAETGRVD